MGVGKKRLILLFTFVIVLVVISFSASGNEVYSYEQYIQPMNGFTLAATESLYPDGETFTLSELSGAYTDVDDDPDSPDGNWLLATGESVDTSVLASFGSPTGNPTVGADLQEFRVLVRQHSQTQSGTPEARIELWENGVLVRAGTLTEVPKGAGIVLSFTWNANELGTADGSLVECYVFGKKSGGGPPARNSVEVGAIEWNVDYTAGGTAYTAYPDGTFSMGGTTALVASFSKTLVEGLALAGATVLAVAFAVTLIQGFTLVGTTALAAAYSKTLVEGFVLTGLTSIFIIIQKLIVEGFALVGVVSLAASYVVTLVQGFALAGATVLAVAFAVTLIQGFSLGGTVTALKVLLVNLQESFAVGVGSTITKIVGTSLIGSMFFQLFLSTNMWGYLGPIALVIGGYIITNKAKNLGVLWFVVESLVIANYLTLVSATPDYWWHIFILLIGCISTLMYSLTDRW